MAVHVLADLKYPDVFAALGRFVADKKLNDICIMEFEDGVIVSGSVFREARDGLRRKQETFVLSGKELEKLIGGKRNLFGR